MKKSGIKAEARPTNSKTKKSFTFVNKVPMVLIYFIVSFLVIGTILVYIILFANNFEIAGTWVLHSNDNSRASGYQYKFNLDGSYSQDDIPIDRKCNLWNCNYEDGRYELETINKKKCINMHPQPHSTYTTCYKIEIIDGKKQLIMIGDPYSSSQFESSTTFVKK